MVTACTSALGWFLTKPRTRITMDEPKVDEL